ncbi:hypothetical protein GcM3_024047 [Golovinomyces cichoracearum]|uniref:Uncharacterized protein n=1 Tax=Golovinomyces cichoracearum TaxID=62708 RepID=A0A420J6M5_9PEZI|nr:hypothetical protein GcM3_024047 [Golovinomyces cichoracearum]
MIVAQCVIIVLGSIKAQLGTDKTSSLVWEKPFHRPSVSVAEIAPSLADAKQILSDAGFLQKKIEGSGMSKYCYDGKHPLSDETDHRPNAKGRNAKISKKIMKTDPRLRVNQEDDKCKVIVNGKKVKRPYKSLTLQQKRECDKARVESAQWQIVLWLQKTDEEHNSIYNKDAVKEEFSKCLKKWSEVGGNPKLSHQCGRAKLLQGIYMGHVSFSGVNSCLSTSEDAFLKLEAGMGWKLELDRKHSVWSDGDIRRTILSWHGNVYIFRFAKTSTSFGCLGYYGAGNPNSMIRRANYQTIMLVLNSKILGDRDKFWKSLASGRAINIARIDQARATS